MRNNGVKLDRIPPQNIDAERSVLGAMMMDGESEQAIARVIQVLGEDGPCFYKEAHQKIYKAILNLFERGVPSDLLTVTQELERTGDLEKAGGVTVLDEIIDSVPTTANVTYYADMVKQEYRRRQLILVSAQVYNEAFDATEDIDTLLGNAENQIFKIMSEGEESSVVAAKTILKEAFKEVQEMYQKGDQIMGLATGFMDLDSLTSGLQNGDYIVVAGRPGMGKSMFIMNVAQYVATHQKIGVLIFSLESKRKFLMLRMLSAESNVEFQKIKSGNLQEADWPRLTISAGVISEAKIFIDDTAGLTPLQIRARAKKTLAQHDIGLIMIDYLQLLGGDGKYENRQQEVTAISRSIQKLASELEIPVVACSQLSRKPEGRAGNRPQLADLRESGSIEQDADLVLFLYREHYYNPQAAEDTAEVIVGKQRHGPTGTVELLFDGARMRFKNLTRRKDLI